MSLSVFLRRAAVCAAALALLLAAPVRAAQPEEALPLTVSVGGQAASSLTDGSRSTKVTLSGNTVTVTAETPFDALYVIWDQPPGEWILTPDGGQPASTWGRQGFLHEYVTLPRAASSATIEAPQGAILCEVYALAGDTPPAWVQVWQPPCEDADLLVLPTHADDEHLWFGGTMPYYAGEKGMAVQVAYMTNHWGEPYRPHELLDGLWTVGVKNYPVISDFPDLYASKASLESAIQVYGEETITAWQVELLRRFKPEVVVAHDINGEYGHGAHQLNAKTLLAALPAAADPAQYTDLPYEPWEVQKAYLHLWPENTITMEWGQMPLEAFGGRTALEMAAEGFACHASQTAWFSVKDSGKNDCRQFGLAYTTVGPDTAKNDFFENVVWPPEPTPEPTPAPTPAPTAEPQPEPAAPSGGLVWIAAAVLGVLALVLLVLAFAARRRAVRRRRARRKYRNR